MKRYYLNKKICYLIDVYDSMKPTLYPVKHPVTTLPITAILCSIKDNIFKIAADLYKLWTHATGTRKIEELELVGDAMHFTTEKMQERLRLAQFTNLLRLTRLYFYNNADHLLELKQNKVWFLIFMF